MCVIMSYKISVIAPNVSLGMFELSVLPVLWEKTEP